MELSGAHQHDLQLAAILDFQNGCLKYVKQCYIFNPQSFNPHQCTNRHALCV